MSDKLNGIKKEINALMLFYWIIPVMEIMLIIVLLVINPSYYSVLILPGDGQPLGWVIISLLVSLLFGLISWSIIITKKIFQRSRVINLLILISFLLLASIALSMTVLAPTIFILFSSPVGTLFFGG